jgi:hypothetical protein
MSNFERLENPNRAASFEKSMKKGWIDKNDEKRHACRERRKPAIQTLTGLCPCH